MLDILHAINSLPILEPIKNNCLYYIGKNEISKIYMIYKSVKPYTFNIEENKNIKYYRIVFIKLDK